MSRKITTYRSNLFYMIGIMSTTGSEGKFFYDAPQQEITVYDKSSFKFSVFGANLTCLMEDPRVAAFKRAKELIQ